MSALRVSRQEFKSFIAAGVVAAKSELSAEDIVALMGVADKVHAAKIGSYGDVPPKLPVPHMEEQYYCPLTLAGIAVGSPGADIFARRFDGCACALAQRKGISFTDHVRVVGD